MEFGEDFDVARIRLANVIRKPVAEFRIFRTDLRERYGRGFSFRRECGEALVDGGFANFPIGKGRFLPDGRPNVLSVETFAQKRCRNLCAGFARNRLGSDFRFEVFRVAHIGGKTFEYFLRQGFGRRLRKKLGPEFGKRRSVAAVVPRRVREQFIGVGNGLWGSFSREQRRSVILPENHIRYGVLSRRNFFEKNLFPKKP